MEPIFKKLSLLLAVLLCTVFAVVIPGYSEAAPASGVPVKQYMHASDDMPVSVLAIGEVTAGETEGVLQKFDTTRWSSSNKRDSQLLYPQSPRKEAIPANPSFSSESNLLRSILTKGP